MIGGGAGMIGTPLSVILYDAVSHGEAVSKGVNGFDPVR